MSHGYAFKPKFHIGDRIFHITPESEVGVILDIRYCVKTGEILYLIALGFNNEVWAIEEELSTSRVIV
jgi:hypothetical protein